VLAHELAFRIHRRVPGVREVTVWLCSTIGQRIDRPTVATVQVCLAPGVSLRRVHAAIRGIIRDGLEDLPSFCEKLARGAYPIC
jgi:S-adenosylmethionine synthetase